MSKTLQWSGILLIAAIAIMLMPNQMLAQSDVEPLLIESKVHYALPDEGGPVEITANLHFVNQDPKTRKKSSGRIFFYNSIRVPISPAAKNIKAIRGNGKKLRINRKATNKGFDILTINFGRRLHYKQEMNIDLSYKLEGITQPHDYVSANTVLLTAYLLGDVGTVSASIPESANYDVNLSSYHCRLLEEPSGMGVWCPDMTDPFAYAFTLEAVKSVESEVLTSKPISLQEKELTLTIVYREGEREWAQKVAATLRKTIPLLEKINGFPYTGPGKLTIVQKSQQELVGYGGRYFNDENKISLIYGATRNTIVHEAAHMWSSPYGQRWLFEGWAEWSAREAIRRAKLKPEAARSKLSDYETEDLPLDDWIWLREIDTESEVDLSGFGYTKSANLINQLVKKVGLKQLKKINRSFLEDGSGTVEPADSESYLQALRDGGFKVEKLWEDFVYH